MEVQQLPSPQAHTSPFMTYQLEQEYTYHTGAYFWERDIPVDAGVSRETKKPPFRAVRDEIYDKTQATRNPKGS